MYNGEHFRIVGNKTANECAHEYNFDRRNGIYGADF